MLVFHSLSNLPLTEGLIYGVHARFWQQPNVIMFMFLSCGVGYVTTFLSHRFGIRKNLKPAVACVFVRSIELGLSGSFQQHNPNTQVLMIGIQVSKQLPYLDLSKDNYLMEYGKALLDPLPQDAILVTTYDIQWTVTRYLQECESHRTDIALLSAPMMSYPWFEHHQKAYKNVRFPGTHLRKVQKEENDTFMTLSEFVEANIENNAAVFIGGNVKHLADWRYNSDAYEHIPYGLSYRPILDGTNELMHELLPNASTYYKDMHDSWHRVSEALPRLASPEKFNDETWEWMTTRDYWIKLGKASIQMAYLATSESSKHESVALSLARCARLGEIVLANENLKELSSSGLAHQILKNTGLCYVRRVFERKFHNHSTLPCFNGRHKNITHSYRMNHRKNQRLNTNSIVT